MTVYRRDGALHGQRPGSPDVPIDGRSTRVVDAELRALQGRRDRAARRANPAYGSLNLDDWTEATSAPKKPGGRPKKTNANPRQKPLDDDEITRIFG